MHDVGRGGGDSGRGRCLFSLPPASVMYVMELKDLISEVHTYLGETLSREKLSPRAEEERLRLVARLGPLGSSTPITTRLGPPQGSAPPAYIDMCRSSTLPPLLHKTEEVSCYELMEDSPPPSKSGSLSRRERFLFLEQSRKVWAKLSGSELALFPGRSESRPAALISMEGYTARPTASSGHKPYTFELVCPGKKTYQFTACSEEDMSSWVEAMCEAGSRSGKRQLPARPPTTLALSQEVYDTPDSRVRPVTPQQDYERMSDSLYHVIGDKRPVLPQEQLYKNIGVGKEEETCYYNLIHREAEQIYQTITEEDKCTSGQSRIQAIIKAMEASIAEAQLYEPVDSTQER